MSTPPDPVSIEWLTTNVGGRRVRAFKSLDEYERHGDGSIDVWGTVAKHFDDDYPESPEAWDRLRLDIQQRYGLGLWRDFRRLVANSRPGRGRGRGRSAARSMAYNRASSGYSWP